MPSQQTDSSYADARDDADPLASLRSEFVGTDADLVYFDGNSLGRPLQVTGDKLKTFVEQGWGSRLIRGWDEGWFDLPLTVGDEIARVCLGAAPGQTTVGDSTTVLLYKMLRAAVDARSGRSEIVIDSDNFPTDRYIVEGIAAERNLAIRCIEVGRDSGVSVDDVRNVVGEQTAVVLLSQVAYRSGHLADVRAITEVVQEAGALTVWDVCHSVGSVVIELDDWGVDLAVGCTYKYLNGGPGSPAFAYVAERHQAVLSQPIQGWMGHADPFAMVPTYEPSTGMRRFLSGTPAVIGMLAMQDMLELIDRVGMSAVRAKSTELTAYAVDLADAMLADLGVVVATPRDPERRGSHITLNHPKMQEVVASLWQRDVVPDYRDPGGLRVGLSPLSTSFAEVLTGMTAVRDTLSSLTQIDP